MNVVFCLCSPQVNLVVMELEAQVMKTSPLRPAVYLQMQIMFQPSETT